MSKKLNSSTLEVESPPINKKLVHSFGIYQTGSFWFYREIVSDQDTKEIISITDSEPDIRVLIVEQIKIKLSKAFQG